MVKSETVPHQSKMENWRAGCNFSMQLTSAKCFTTTNTDAKLGKLLQMAFGGATPFIGMRTEHGLGNDAQGALLVLTGDERGTMLIGLGEVSGPAADVGALVEIVACSAAPKSPSLGVTLKGGMLLGDNTAPGTYYVCVHRMKSKEVYGVVCVRSPKEEEVGKFLPVRTPSRFTILSETTSVRLRRDRVERLLTLKTLLSSSS